MKIGSRVIIGRIDGYEHYFNKVGTLEEYTGPSDFDFTVYIPGDAFHVYKHEVSLWTKGDNVLNKIKALYAKNSFSKERMWHV